MGGKRQIVLVGWAGWMGGPRRPVARPRLSFWLELGLWMWDLDGRMCRICLEKFRETQISYLPLIKHLLFTRYGAGC